MHHTRHKQTTCSFTTPFIKALWNVHDAFKLILPTTKFTFVNKFSVQTRLVKARTCQRIPHNFNLRKVFLTRKNENAYAPSAKYLWQ